MIFTASPGRATPAAVLVDGHVFQVLDEGRPGVPGRRRAPGSDVVADEAGDGDGDDVLQPDPAGEAAVVGGDGLEHPLVVGDEVHLGHRQHHPLDADQTDQEAVPPRLGEHAFARVHQDHRQVGGGGAGDHVAGVLLVAGGVGDDELALVGGEEAVGDIDGDPLLALGGEAVDQEGEIDRPALRADLAGIRLQRRQLVLEDHLRIVEQPSDQGRLAVVHRPAGDEPQQPLGLMRRQIPLDIRRDEIGGVGHGYPTSLPFMGRDRPRSGQGGEVSILNRCQRNSTLPHPALRATLPMKGREELW
jgi:hypothetical protein